MVSRALASWYVLLLNTTFDLMVYPGQIRSNNRGLMARFSRRRQLIMGIPAGSVATTTLRMNSSSQTMMDMFFTTPVDLSRAVKTS